VIGGTGWACAGGDSDLADSPASKYLGAPIQTVPGRAKAADPITYLTPGRQLTKFASTFRNATVKVPGGSIKVSVYYVPGIIAFGLIAAAFSNLTLTAVRNRASGIYKRRRATPLPASAVIAARALVAVFTALAITAVLLAIGWAAYGAKIPSRTAPAFVLDVIVGAAALCCLGFAAASLIRTVDAAQPVIQAIVLPLSFISGIFIATSALPRWLADIGKVFPVEPLAAAVLAAYNPHTTGSGLRWERLRRPRRLGAAGLIIAVRRFNWLRAAAEDTSSKCMTGPRQPYTAASFLSLARDPECVPTKEARIAQRGDTKSHHPPAGRRRPPAPARQQLPGGPARKRLANRQARTPGIGHRAPAPGRESHDLPRPRRRAGHQPDRQRVRHRAETNRSDQGNLRIRPLPARRLVRPAQVGAGGPAARHRRGYGFAASVAAGRAAAPGPSRCPDARQGRLHAPSGRARVKMASGQRQADLCRPSRGSGALPRRRSRVPTGRRQPRWYASSTPRCA